MNRVDVLMFDIERNDNSFTEKGNVFSSLFGHKYSQGEAREIWFQGIRHGLEIGLRKASIEGQRIEITSNMTNERHKEFYSKFLELANKYNCQIQYHSNHGMMVIDLNRDYE
jgi:hypothetical protein